MRVHRGRSPEPGAREDGRPEQRVEVQDVLADEMVQFRSAVGAPPGVEVELPFAGERKARAHVAHRCVQPDVEILAGVPGNLEAEVGCIARDVPVAKAGIEPLIELVRDAVVQGAGARPLAKHRLEGAEAEEQMFRFALDRTRAADDRHRIDQIRRRIGRAADLATVTVLVRRLAARAGPLDVTVRQEHLRLGVVRLADRPARDVAAAVERLEDPLGHFPVFVRMRRVEVVVRDQEVRVRRPVLGGDLLDQLLGRDAFGLCLQHHRRAVRIVCADVDALMAAQAHEAHPDVGLDGLEDVPEVQRSVGVGKGAGDEDAAHGCLGGQGMTE